MGRDGAATRVRREGGPTYQILRALAVDRHDGVAGGEIHLDTLAKRLLWGDDVPAMHVALDR